MENKFLGALNGVQQIYNDLGVLVPVGDLSTGKSPVVQVLPATIPAKLSWQSGK